MAPFSTLAAAAVALAAFVSAAPAEQVNDIAQFNVDAQKVLARTADKLTILDLLADQVQNVNQIPIKALPSPIPGSLAFCESCVLWVSTWHPEVDKQTAAKYDAACSYYNPELYDDYTGNLDDYCGHKYGKKARRNTSKTITNVMNMTSTMILDEGEQSVIAVSIMEQVSTEVVLTVEVASTSTMYSTISTPATVALSIVTQAPQTTTLFTGPSASTLTETISPSPVTVTSIIASIVYPPATSSNPATTTVFTVPGISTVVQLSGTTSISTYLPSLITVTAPITTSTVTVPSIITQVSMSTTSLLVVPSESCVPSVPHTAAPRPTADVVTCCIDQENIFGGCDFKVDHPDNEMEVQKVYKKTMDCYCSRTGKAIKKCYKAGSEDLHTHTPERQALQVFNEYTCDIIGKKPTRLADTTSVNIIPSLSTTLKAVKHTSTWTETIPSTVTSVTAQTAIFDVFGDIVNVNAAAALNVPLAGSGVIIAAALFGLTL